MKVKITASCVIDFGDGQPNLEELKAEDGYEAMEQLITASEGEHEDTKFKIEVNEEL